MIHEEVRKKKPIRADRHFGQVISLENEKSIISELATKPIIENYYIRL